LNFVAEGMPTVSEVCESFGLQDIEIDYAEEEYQSISTYKQFQQQVRPLIQKENPKVQVVQHIAVISFIKDN